VAAPSPATKRSHGRAHSLLARDHQPRLLTLLLVGSAALYLLALLRTAWISDDAFITMRALDNLIQGYGLVSDPPDRVLGFTNPLWAFVLLLPLSIDVDPYWAAMAAALVVSCASLLFVMMRAAATPWTAALAAFWLATSAAYVDFSSSGLENPLAHLLLAVFFSALIADRLDPRRPLAWLLAGLIALNRLDHALLVAPAIACLLIGARDRDQHTVAAAQPAVTFARVARAAALGSLPLVMWFGFALVYYGFPFPNTAYAKLNTRVPASTLAHQGLLYFVDGLRRDPLTLCVIAIALISLVRERSLRALSIAGGLLLYLGYIVRIGGDFMAGRFFTAPFLVAVLWLAARGLTRASRPAVWFVLGGSVLLALLYPTNFRFGEKLECNFDASGIANERHCYAPVTALSQNLTRRTYQSEGRYVHGEELWRAHARVSLESNVGMTGYAAGPEVHLIDLLALTDPLLARIPYQPHNDFRIGHFHRDAPAGYEATLLSGHNQIEDPCLHAYYDALRPVLRGPLFTLERWRAIWGFHTGRYDWLMQQPCKLRRSD
jgi:arabinofuranosyltransferase